MNNFLRTRFEIDEATKYLKENKLVESGLSCKNWEIASIIPHLTDSELCDLGSDGSVVIPNALALGLKGTKVGIDLAYKEDIVTPDGVHYIKGDLMQTPFENESFDIVTSLSVVEHSVDVNKFAQECHRILKPEGKLFVSFDYWPEKINTKGILLYNLEWNIMDRYEAFLMVSAFLSKGFALTSQIDWTVQDKVIDETFCSPAKGIGYTFGMINLIKK